MASTKTKRVPMPDMGKPMTANDINMTVNWVSRHQQPEAKTSGIKIRGTGAATKGTMARGPMA